MLTAAFELARDWLSRGEVEEITVEAGDERGQRVLTITLALRVKREPHHLLTQGEP